MALTRSFRETVMKRVQEAACSAILYSSSSGRRRGGIEDGTNTQLPGNCHEAGSGSCV
jgi:hypothetical protein